jgi:transcriptional regulator with XRE-family HTH domain
MIVRKLRLQRGWTQAHLASLTGLSVRGIQRIEQGSSISLETQSALATVFVVDRSNFQPREFPILDAAEAEAIKYVKGQKEFYQHLAIYLLVTPVFALLWGADQRFFWNGGRLGHWCGCPCPAGVRVGEVQCGRLGEAAGREAAGSSLVLRHRATRMLAGSHERSALPALSSDLVPCPPASANCASLGEYRAHGSRSVR